MPIIIVILLKKSKDQQKIPVMVIMATVLLVPPRCHHSHSYLFLDPASSSRPAYEGDAGGESEMFMMHLTYTSTSHK